MKIFQLGKGREFIIFENSCAVTTKLVQILLYGPDSQNVLLQEWYGIVHAHKLFV